MFLNNFCQKHVGFQGKKNIIEVISLEKKLLSKIQIRPVNMKSNIKFH